METSDLQVYSPGRRSRSGSPARSLASSAHSDGGARGRSPGRRDDSSRRQRRPSSVDFKDKIRELEEEGTKLMVAASSLGDSLISGHGVQRPSALTASSQPRTPYSPGSLSALADISSEQQTISELKSRLEQQTRETERFTRDLLGDSAALKYSAPGHDSVLSKLEIPTPSSTQHTSHHPGDLTAAGAGYGGGLARAGSLDYISMSAGDRQLQQTREDNLALQTKLRETYESNEKQKVEFRMTIEELKTRLQEAVIGRDTLVGMKKRESASQDVLIQRLQQTIEQLEKANRAQEETLLEMNAKMEGTQKEHFSLESTFNQVRNLLMDQERKRGRPYFEMEPVTRQNATMIVRTIDRCIRELDSELDIKHEKIKKIQTEAQDSRLMAEDQLRQMERDHRDRISTVKDELESQVETATDRLATAKQQVNNVQDQLALLQQQGEQQVQLKDERLQDLQERLQASRIEMDEERHQWKIKKDALELAIDQTQKELVTQRAERDEAVRVKAGVETRFNDMQETINQLRSEVTTGRQQEKQLERVVQELKMKEAESDGRVREKESTIHNLELVLTQVKAEADRNLQNTVITLEREGQEKIAHQATSMDVQLRCMTEQCHKLTKELDETKERSGQLAQQVAALKDADSKQKENLGVTTADRDHLNNLLQDRVADVGRLTEERDSYFKLLDERNQEIESLQTTKEKLTIQLDEREKNFISLQQQNEKMAELSENSSKSVAGFKEERDDLQAKLNEKIIEIEEMRHQRDSLSKKVGKRDKQAKEMEDDNIKMAKDIRDKKVSIEKLLQDKEKLFNELKESRYEIATFREDKDQLKRQLEVKKGDLGKEINKLHGKLRAAQHDLKLAQKTLQTREGVDNKAVKVAGKMQKEVTEKRGQIDSLYSKIRWLEDKMEHNGKEKRAMGEETEKLVSTVQKTAQQNERLSAELKNYLTKNNELRDKVSKVEKVLEKAAVKQAASQATLEQYEQDIARLKLKHQLELKEMSRTGHVKREPERSDLIRAVKPASHSLKPVSHTPLHHPPTKSASQGGHSRSQGGHSQSRPANKGRSSSEEPISIKPTQLNAAVENAAVGGELRMLLDEMRSLVYKQQAQEIQHHSGYNGHTESDDQSEFSDTNRRPHKKTSRPMGGSKRQSHARSVSPVSGLLVTATDDVLDTGSISDGSVVSDCSEPLHEHTDGEQAVPIELLSSDTQSLCKRLEQKIENLTKMGGHLQHENKEMAKLMKDQDKQLKHVKKQIKS